MHYVCVVGGRTLEAFASFVRSSVVAIFAMAISLCATQASAQVRYNYDELGRLVQVVAPDGQSALYNYDAVGNIVSINRFGSTTVSITEFTPNAGPVGANVTIYGSGFKGNPADNTVQFNGTTASVSTASTNSLVVTVPQGATSGPISVSNTNGSVSTSATFTVGALNQAPTIASFTPDIGTAGTVVSVTGTNFQTSSTGNKATVGGVAASIVQDGTSPTATLVKPVVSAASSGKIAIRTPYGNATSTADFYALPAGVNAADVEFKGRIAVDGSALNVVTTSPGKKAVLLFDGQKGQRLHMVSASGTFASAISVAVYSPVGNLVENLTLPNQGVANFASPLSLGAAGGSYTIILSPQPTNTGSISVTLKSDVFGTWAVDGVTPVNLSAGRWGHYSFTAEAGKGYGLGLVAYSATPATTLTITLRNPYGISLSTCNIFVAGVSCNFAPSLFASAGTYMFDVTTNTASAISFNASLSMDTGGVLTIDAATPTTMTVARAGQNGRYTFTGTAGDSLSIVLSAMQGITSTTNVKLYRPSDGAVAGEVNVYNGSGGALNVTLPQTGAYTVFVDPMGLDAGTIDVHVKTWATGPLTVDGTTPVNLSAGRMGRYSFTAEAGKGYGLALPGFTVTPANTVMFTTLRKADGTQLATCNIYNGTSTCSYAPSLFPAAGTHMIDFVPGNSSAVSFNASFSKDTGGVLTIDAATPTTMTIARAGQNGRYTFSGTAGDLVTIVLSNMQGITSVTNVKVYRPSNGASIATMNVYNGGGGTLNATLPDTGTYTVFVDNWGLDTGSIDLDVKAGVAIASGNIGGAYAAAMAIDEKNSTMWNSGFSAGNTWWGLDFGSQVAVTGYTIRTRSDGYLNDSPTAWTEEGWNGSSWVAIGTQTTSANWGLGEVRSFTVSSPAAYTKFRLRFTNLQGGVSHSNVAIAEFTR